MVESVEKVYFTCDRCKKKTDVRESYEFENRRLCTSCYRNEARRGIDDIALHRRNKTKS